MRIRVWIAAAVVSTLCLSVGGQQARPVPGLDKARAEYEQAIHSAHATYNSTVKVAAAEYYKRLATLLNAETRAGNLDGSLKIRERMEEMDTQGPPLLPDAPRFAGKESWAVGTWMIRYHPNGVIRTYDVAGDGTVKFQQGNRTGVLRRSGNAFMLDLGDGKLERLTFVGGRMFCEHYAPKDDFVKNRVDQIGVGELLKRD